MPHSLAVDYPLSEADGTKGSALCGALPSAPSVELFGEHSSGDTYHLSGMSLDHITLLRLGRLLPSWCEVSLYPAPWGGWGLYFMEVPF